MKKTPRNPDLNKAAVYAVVVNAIQLLMLLLFVLYVTLGNLSNQNRIYLQVIAVAVAVMAGWGAVIAIQDALHARRLSRTIDQLQTVNRQMDALNLEMRAQRHDFLGHIQVVYSLLQMEEHQEAVNYLETVYSQLHTVSRVLRTKMTAFNALLQVKSAVCEERGIALEMDVRSTLEGLTIPPWELCCVTGNLLDNAIDAASFAAEPRIHLAVTENLRQVTLTIHNNGATVPQPIRSRIFEPGVTSKGKDHGMGLAIVSKTLNQYGGSIALDASDHSTTFTITLPRGGVANEPTACVFTAGVPTASVPTAGEPAAGVRRDE